MTQSEDIMQRLVAIRAKGDVTERVQELKTKEEVAELLAVPADNARLDRLWMDLESAYVDQVINKGLPTNRAQSVWLGKRNYVVQGELTQPTDEDETPTLIPGSLKLLIKLPLQKNAHVPVAPKHAAAAIEFPPGFETLRQIFPDASFPSSAFDVFEAALRREFGYAPRPIKGQGVGKIEVTTKSGESREIEFARRTKGKEGHHEYAYKLGRSDAERQRAKNFLEVFFLPDLMQRERATIELEEFTRFDQAQRQTRNRG
jgi:hypothetical protein